MGEDVREEIKKLKEELEKLKRALKKQAEQESEVKKPVKIPIFEAGAFDVTQQKTPVRYPQPPPMQTIPAPPSTFEDQIIKDILQTFRKSVMQVSDRYIAVEKLIEDLSPEGAAQALTVIANDIRIKILKMLYKEGKYFSDIEQATGLNPSPLNFHLSKLLHAGFIAQERARGRYIITQKGRVVLTLIGYFWSRFKEVAYI